MTKENLGPAERILNTVLAYSDHAVHNRAGIVIPDAGSAAGVKWLPVTHVVEEGEKVVYELRKVGNKSVKFKLGKLNDGRIKDGNRVVGRYQPAGIYPEVATWLYQQISEVWQLDNEFAAKWASYAYPQEHRDLKVIMAAFLLVQSRKGDPVVDGGKVAFYDEDYRDVGEAMLLLSRKDLAAGAKDFNPKLLLRVHDVLRLPGVAEINRRLGFGLSTRNPFLGRWPKAVEKWLRFREENQRMLEGLVKAGFRRTVIDMARRIGYKPRSPRFFEVLRWPQVQSENGHREIAIGVAVSAAESWVGFSEEQICETIQRTKPNFKRIVGLLPSAVGLTRAIMAVAIDSGAMSDKDLIINTPTLEDLGLLEVQEIKARWDRAIKGAEDMRAANIASRVRGQAVKDQLQDAADNAVKTAVAEVIRGLRIYFMVDISASMDGTIARAKEYIGKFLQAFPVDQLHVATFNTQAREVTIKHSSSAGVEQAFRGITAGGGTSHASAVKLLSKHKPKEGEDALFIFVGDQQDNTFTEAVRGSGLNPIAFGFLYVPGNMGNDKRAVADTATQLAVPCFNIDERIFADPYAIPRTIRAMVAATPVGTSVKFTANPRKTLVDTIMDTKLLQKPVWAIPT